MKFAYRCIPLIVVGLGANMLTAQSFNKGIYKTHLNIERLILGSGHLLLTPLAITFKADG